MPGPKGLALAWDAAAPIHDQSPIRRVRRFRYHSIRHVERMVYRSKERARSSLRSKSQISLGIVEPQEVHEMENDDADSVRIIKLWTYSTAATTSSCAYRRAPDFSVGSGKTPSSFWRTGVAIQFVRLRRWAQRRYRASTKRAWGF